MRTHGGEAERDGLTRAASGSSDDGDVGFEWKHDGSSMSDARCAQQVLPMRVWKDNSDTGGNPRLRLGCARDGMGARTMMV